MYNVDRLVNLKANLMVLPIYLLLRNISSSETNKSKDMQNARHEKLMVVVDYCSSIREQTKLLLRLIPPTTVYSGCRSPGSSDTI